MNEPEKNSALIICAHGSADNDYNRDFSIFFSKIKAKIKKNVFYCFVEKSEPSIQQCIELVSKSYPSINFLPLFIFNGYHVDKDIRNELKIAERAKNAKINLIEKVSLFNDISTIVNEEIKKKLKTDKENVIIVSCSNSSENNLKIELNKYIEKICPKIDNKFSCLSGDEESVLTNLDKFDKNNINVIVHPLFFFGGYLYKKNIKILKTKHKLNVLLPLSYYEEIINLMVHKLIAQPL